MASVSSSGIVRFTSEARSEVETAAPTSGTESPPAVELVSGKALVLTEVVLQQSAEGFIIKNKKKYCNENCEEPKPQYRYAVKTNQSAWDATEEDSIQGA